MRIAQIEIRNFRGIATMDWSPEAGLNCLIGPGDSTKTTILDAIELVLNPRSNFIGDDADFHNQNHNLPVTITLALVQIPEDFCTDARYGLHLRGWDSANKAVVDEPGPGLEEALSIRVKPSSLTSQKISSSLAPFRKSGEWVETNTCPPLRA